MKINYYQDTDSLYISFNNKASIDTREVVAGLNIDLDEKGHVTGIDIDHAKWFVDLAKLETDNLPLKKVKLG